jgi:mannose-6-phosphate isomerase-like protein (cupin superfamily)
MQRRNFIFQSGLLAAFGAGFPTVLGAQSSEGEIMDNPIEPIHLESLPALDHGGSMNIRVWVRNAMTNGLFSSVECAVAPKLMGPPPHAHKELDELMFVISGTASVLEGDEIVHIKAGGWHLRPRQLKHTFWNASEDPLRFYDMYFNQPFEEYLEKIFFELNDAHEYPEGSDKKRDAIGKLNDDFGLIFQADAFSQRDAIKKEFGLAG